MLPHFIRISPCHKQALFESDVSRQGTHMAAEATLYRSNSRLQGPDHNNILSNRTGHELNLFFTGVALWPWMEEFVLWWSHPSGYE